MPNCKTIAICNQKGGTGNIHLASGWISGMKIMLC